MRNKDVHSNFHTPCSITVTHNHCCYNPGNKHLFICESLYTYTVSCSPWEIKLCILRDSERHLYFACHNFHFLKLPFCWKKHGVSILGHCCSASSTMFSLTFVLFIFLCAVCLLKILAEKLFFFCLFRGFCMLIISLLFGIFVQVCTVIELIRLQLMTELSIERFCGCLFLLFGPLF